MSKIKRRGEVAKIICDVGSAKMSDKRWGKSFRRFLGLMAFIATGGGLIVTTIITENNFYKTEILIIFGVLFAISLVDHFRKVRQLEGVIKFDKRKIYTLICAFVGVTFTWFINHEMGYGAIVANGLIGVIAAVALPNDLAGITYTSSFIGMSSLAVIPSMGAAVLASIIVGLILIITVEIYAGIGGKGGTTAALSTIITRAILNIFS